MYPDLLFGDMPWKPLKLIEKGVYRPDFTKFHLLFQAEGGSGWQWVTWLNGIPSLFKCTYCVNSKVTAFKMWRDSVILRIIKKEEDRNFVCYFHIIHIFKQAMNQIKCLVQFLLTFLTTRKSQFMYLKALAISAPFMLPLAVCQLNTA